MQGFTYNGIHSSKMGVFFIPDEIERGDFQADYEVVESDKTWHPGGEYFHSRVKTRVFNLSCYYEEITIEQREAILRWLDRRTQGELIFDDRAYAVYTVRPTKKIEFKDWLQSDHINGADLYSGTFTIVFSAYDPFALLKPATSSSLGATKRAMAETGLISERQMPAPPDINNANSFLLYNPGTEYGHTVIRFSGKVGSSDFVITNTTTGDKCVLKSGLDLADGEYVEINSKTGRIELVKDGERTLYFAFHDEGYIRLAPCTPFYRNVYLNTSSGSKVVTGKYGTFNDSMVGQWVFVADKWRYIGSVNSHCEIEVNTPIEKNLRNTRGDVVTMNYITIEKASDANVTLFEVDCRAEVR